MTHLHIPGTFGRGAGVGGEGARLMIRLQFGLKNEDSHGQFDNIPCS